MRKQEIFHDFGVTVEILYRPYWWDLLIFYSDHHKGCPLFYRPQLWKLCTPMASNAQTVATALISWCFIKDTYVEKTSIHYSQTSFLQSFLQPPPQYRKEQSYKVKSKGFLIRIALCWCWLTFSDTLKLPTSGNAFPEAAAGSGW